MKNDKRELVGTLLVVAAATSWGLTGIFVRYFTSLGLSSLQITVFKIFFASIVLLIYCLIFNREALKINLKDIWIFAGAGLISMDFFSVCYFSTIQSTSLSVAAVLLYGAPAIVMLMSAVLFKDKITLIKVLACAVAFLGCFFTAGIIGSGTTIPFNAFCTGILSAFGYALYSIFGQISINKGYKPITMTTYTFLFAAVGTMTFFRPSEIVAAAGRTSTIKFVLVMVLMSFIVSLLPYILYTNGLTFIKPSKASIIASVEPVAATVVGAVVFSEMPDVFGFIGIVCVVTAVVLLNLNSSGKSAE
ncbi:MAG: DMT family transporter [Oscillospiraceae bacterium]|nr:DMT family transporter [Oscillospiraceae bacterium]